MIGYPGEYREGIPASEAAKRYIADYFRDMNALAVRPADAYAYVTQFIPQIIAFVQKLIKKGHAYVLEGEGDRDVYFSTDSFPGYGKLSRRNREAMEAGGRLEPDERKRNPRDLPSGKRRNRGRRGGIAPGVMDVLVGISSVLRWQWKRWVNRSISMAAVPI